MRSEGGSKIDFSDDKFEGNEYGKVEGRLLVELLWVEFETELGPCEGISDGRDVVKMEVFGER